MRQQILRAIAVAAAAAALAAAGGVPAAAASNSTANDAVIRGAHFSPNMPGVDVYLTAFDGTTKLLWLSGVGYGDVSGYQRFAPGLYAVSMRPHDASPSSPPALTWTLDARAGAAYTACAVGMNAQLHGIVLDDDLQPPAAGQARVRVIQAASRAPQARVTLSGGATLASDVAFATTSAYRTVPAGTYTLDAAALGTSAVHASTRVQFRSDAVYTVVVLDGKAGGITLRAIDDASGAAVAPVGAVPAGGGGTAHQSDSTWPVLAMLAVLAAWLVALAGAALLRERRVLATR